MTRAVPAAGVAFAALIGAVALLGAAAGCVPHPLDAVKRDVRSRYPDVPQLEVSELQEWLAGAERRPLLIDVRTREEFAVSHLAGALHAETTTDVWSALKGAPEAVPVVLYCSVGERSSRLVQELRTASARSSRPIYNLEGSLFEWAMRGGELWCGDRRVETVHPYDEEWGRLLPKELRWSSDAVRRRANNTGGPETKE